MLVVSLFDIAGTMRLLQGDDKCKKGKKGVGGTKRGGRHIYAPVAKVANDYPPISRTTCGQFGPFYFPNGVSDASLS